MAAKAKAKRAKSQPVERRALTIEEFCQAYHMSTDHYFVLKRQGKGPREMKLGTKKKMISLRAAERWEIEREQATENEEREEEQRQTPLPLISIGRTSG